MKIRFFIVGFLTLLLILSYSLYLYKYQQLVNEGSFLADEHCIVINPLIIERKKAYIDTMKTLMSENNKDYYLSANENYLEATKLYMAKEREWLERQYDYIHRWDFQFFIDKEVKEAGKWQYKSYQADYDSSDAMVRMWVTKSPEEQKFFSDLIILKGKEQTEADKKYQAIWDNHKRGFDLRNYIISIPPSQCPAKNYDIPDVRKEIGF